MEGHEDCRTQGCWNPRWPRDPDAWESLTLDVAASRLDRAGTTVRLRQILAAAT